MSQIENKIEKYILPWWGRVRGGEGQGCHRKKGEIEGKARITSGARESQKTGSM